MSRKYEQIINSENILCDYGCGHIAKYRFNNGKYCCEDHYCKCPCIISKNRNTQIGRKRPKEEVEVIRSSVIDRMARESKEEKKKYGSKKRTINSVLKLCPIFLDYEEIRTNPISENELQVRCKNPNCEHSKENDGWFTPNPRSIEYRLTCLNNDRFTAGWFYCTKECMNGDENHKKTFSKTMLNYYKNLDQEEHNKKYLYPRRITLEQIKERYPNFYEIEEIRYKPGEEYKRIIQGHCKNPNCEHSKENDGWFDLDRRQLEGRISALENPRVTANLYFFCSSWCKKVSGLFNRPPDSLQDDDEFIKYRREVWRYTYYSVKENKSKIKNIEKRSKKFHLDHKFSIAEGYRHDIDPMIIAHWKNLEILSEFDNISKHDKCSITLEELLNEIKILNDYRRLDMKYSFASLGENILSRKFGGSSIGL